MMALFFNNLQIVFNDKLANFEEVRKLTISSSIIVTGKVVKTENAKQPFEIHVDSVEIFNLADSDYPLQKKRHSFEYLRTVAHLRPRTNTFNAVFRIRSVAAFAIHEYFQNNGYVYVNTPIITCADCEGSAEMEFCDKFIEQGLIDKLHKLVNSKFVRIDHMEAMHFVAIC